MKNNTTTTTTLSASRQKGKRIGIRFLKTAQKTCDAQLTNQQKKEADAVVHTILNTMLVKGTPLHGVVMAGHY